jgi:SAM-dependent methyltransferase
MMRKVQKLGTYLWERGPLWTLLYFGRFLCLQTLVRFERGLIWVEKRKFLTGPETVSSSRHTVKENRMMWDSYDWSRAGEEWTQGVKRERGLDPERWKAQVVNDMMVKYVKPGSTVLEIGPGAGRWTKILRPLSARLILADISARCLSICRAEFNDYNNIEYYLIRNDGLDRILENTVDAVWSYDVFVHINPRDTERYVAAFSRLLKAGGCAVIHHSGSYPSEAVAADGFRSDVDERFFAHFAKKHGLEVIEQNTALPHKIGDVISVIRKPAASHDARGLEERVRSLEGQRG